MYRSEVTEDRSQCLNKDSIAVKSLLDHSVQQTSCPDLSVALSCCDAPASLGDIWVLHKKAILATLSVLQGVHGAIVRKDGEQVAGSDISIKIHTEQDRVTSSSFK